MTKSQKKTIIILVVAVLVLGIVVSAICAFAWYQRSALPTAVTMGRAISERDAETLFECIETDDLTYINFFMALFSLTKDDVLNIAFPEESDNEIEEVKLRDYSESGKTASLSVTLIYENGDQKDMTLTFVKEGAEWKLSVDELIQL